MVRLRQKISGGLRARAGAEIFCAVRSYLSTAHKQGLNAIETLTQLHNGRALDPRNELNSYDRSQCMKDGRGA